MSSNPSTRLSPLVLFCALQSITACASEPMDGGDAGAGGGGGGGGDPSGCFDSMERSSVDIENATDVTLVLGDRRCGAKTIAPGAVGNVYGTVRFGGRSCDAIFADFTGGIGNRLVLESEDGMYVVRLPVAEGWTPVNADDYECGSNCSWIRTITQADLEPLEAPPPPAGELAASQGALRDRVCACPLDRFSSTEDCEQAFDLARLAGDPECVDAAVAEDASVAAWYACEAAAVSTLGDCGDEVTSCVDNIAAYVDTYLDADCPAPDGAGAAALAQCEATGSVDGGVPPAALPPRRSTRVEGSRRPPRDAADSTG